MSKLVPSDVAPASAAPAQGPSFHGQVAQGASVDAQLNTQSHPEMIKTKQFRASTLASATAAVARLRRKSGR